MRSSQRLRTAPRQTAGHGLPQLAERSGASLILPFVLALVILLGTTGYGLLRPQNHVHPPAPGAAGLARLGQRPLREPAGAERLAPPARHVVRALGAEPPGGAEARPLGAAPQSRARRGAPGVEAVAVPDRERATRDHEDDVPREDADVGDVERDAVACARPGADSARRSGRRSPTSCCRAARRRTAPLRLRRRPTAASRGPPSRRRARTTRGTSLPSGGDTPSRASSSSSFTHWSTAANVVAPSSIARTRICTRSVTTKLLPRSREGETWALTKRLSRCASRSVLQPVDLVVELLAPLREFALAALRLGVREAREAVVQLRAKRRHLPFFRLELLEAVVQLRRSPPSPHLVVPEWVRLKVAGLRHHLLVRLCARNGIATLVSFASALALAGAALGTDGTTTPDADDPDRAAVRRRGPRRDPRARRGRRDHRRAGARRLRSHRPRPCSRSRTRQPACS